MIDWQKYWDEYPRKFDDRDFLQHVSRTVNGGVPIDPVELDVLIDQLSSVLELKSEHRHLDLCCGNGLLTKKLAARCGEVVGVDFADAMIEIAKRHQSGESIHYVLASVLELTAELVGKKLFDTVSLIESLHYLRPTDIDPLMASIARVTKPKAVAVLVGVTDAERIYNFFNTPERVASLELQRKEGKEIMGHWWSRGEIETAASNHGFEATFLMQDERLNTSHYRFDVRLTRV